MCHESGIRDFNWDKFDILMYAQPVRGFHAWHRGFVELIGEL